MDKKRTVQGGGARQPQSYKDLMRVYGCTRVTLMNWLQPHMEDIGEKRGRYFTIAQVDIIYIKLGRPDID
jgi:hypothetical protein